MALRRSNTQVERSPQNKIKTEVDANLSANNPALKGR